MRTTVLLLLALTVPAMAATPKKNLKSKDVQVRLKAVASIRAAPGEDAEELLLGALKDRDWEVVEDAAVALGEIGGEESVKPLLIQALAGPVRRIRFAAIDSLLEIDPDQAAARIAGRVGGKTALVALEALHRMGKRVGRDDLETSISRGLAEKQAVVRAAAASLVGAFDGRKRRELLGKLFRQPEVSVRAAVLDAIIDTPDEGDIPALLSELRNPEHCDVLTRRVLAAMVAVVETGDTKDAADRLGRRALLGSENAKDPKVAARFARLAGMLGETPPAPERELGTAPDDEPAPSSLVSGEIVGPALANILKHPAPAARAAAAFALGRIATGESLDRAAELADKDADGTVRLHALRAVHRVRGIGHEAMRALAIRRLAEDTDPRVREFAAVTLGKRGLDEAVPALKAALADANWGVAVCAAVSLGKTECPAAREDLTELLTHRDWKLQAAGVVGLGRLRSVGAVPDVIAALGHKDSFVSGSALSFLKHMTVKDIRPTAKAWSDWWDTVKDRYTFPDLEKQARDAKKYGYASTYRGVYENLDVVVLQSRGDSIEKLLDRLSIKHRLTRSGQVESAGLHPFAIFVANCTGEITPKDAERLAWFVRVGGYLFGSCWALSETIEQVYPGVVRKLPTLTEVLDNVEAKRCPVDSPYLTGVFTGVTRPIYVLYGAHLIEVMDPERVEVLMDSPQCADRFLEGNLACWFDAGHGVILDSVNHFDLQGLERAVGLKTADDRMGYAIDHMGMSYEEAREIAAKRIWSSRSKAAAEARDLSAFRFITNFVRHKRKVDR